MKSRKIALIAGVFVCLLTILCIYGLLISGQHENVHDLPFAFFTFDTETITHDIQIGELPSLKQISEEQYNFLKQSKRKDFTWTDKEYFGIQDRIFSILGVSDGMNIDMLNYVFLCENLTEAEFVGITSTSFSLKIDGFHKYFIDIGIRPSLQTAVAYPREYYPVYSYTEKPIRLDKMNFSYIDILKIAEENGGERFRENLDNECKVNIVYAPNSFIKNWQVEYEGKQTNLELEIIDKTGELEIQTNK